LDNAVKFTPAGGEIVVDLQADLARQQCVLSVRDTGSGIPAEDMPHVFDRFFRGDPARQTGGTGLGLAIARLIVEQHGGSIELFSEPGRGSTFRVFLPLNQPAVAPAEA
jgi:signal transduction histidine kinase